MAKIFLQLGGLLLFNNRHKSVRRGVIFLFTNFLLVAAVIFTVEIILIFLGVGNVFVPLTSSVRGLLTKFAF